MEERQLNPAVNRKPVLVVGYGNTLRGDDGAGPEVARILAECKLPFVETHQMTQLMPELAGQIAVAQAVIFVDASSAPGETAASIKLLEPAAIGLNPAHSISPPDILRLAIDCYDFAPRAWLVAVAGFDFGFSNQLSENGRSNVAKAVMLIKDHLDRLCSNGQPTEKNDAFPTCEVG